MKTSLPCWCDLQYQETTTRRNEPCIPGRPATPLLPTSQEASSTLSGCSASDTSQQGSNTNKQPTVRWVKAYFGCLALYKDEWVKINCDPRILGWISGYAFPFTHVPSQVNIPENNYFSVG